VICSLHIACVQRRRPGVLGLNGDGTGKFQFEGMNIEGRFCDLVMRSGEYKASSFVFVCLVRVSLFEDRGVVRCDVG
jgi:hypothetical protein